jgi:hypothetical protein
MVGAMGMPQYTMVEMELMLDEENVLYKAEEMFRLYGGLVGEVEGAIQAVGGMFTRTI